MADSAPTYILTAELDSASFAWLDGLRRRHFSPERNVLSAHLTMFHKLTAAQIALLGHLELAHEPPRLTFDAPLFLGQGVAIRVQSPALDRIRRDIRQRVSEGLSRQDAQGWRAHVTVQNKVRPEVARALHQMLQDGFAARHGVATALLVWEYLGGPWRCVERLPFAAVPGTGTIVR